MPQASSPNDRRLNQGAKGFRRHAPCTLEGVDEKEARRRSVRDCAFEQRTEPDGRLAPVTLLRFCGRVAIRRPAPAG